MAAADGVAYPRAATSVEPRLPGTALIVLSAVLAGERAVVVKPFTSPACSSCPPAQACLGNLARQPGVLPPSFHVTSWDRLGLKDPYSLDAATARQARDGERFGDGSQTPEMAVDRTAALVGSSRDAGTAALAAA